MTRSPEHLQRLLLPTSLVLLFLIACQNTNSEPTTTNTVPSEAVAAESQGGSEETPTVSVTPSPTVTERPTQAPTVEVTETPEGMVTVTLDNGEQFSFDSRVLDNLPELNEVIINNFGELTIDGFNPPEEWVDGVFLGLQDKAVVVVVRIDGQWQVVKVVTGTSSRFQMMGADETGQWADPALLLSTFDLGTQVIATEGSTEFTPITYGSNGVFETIDQGDVITFSRVMGQESSRNVYQIVQDYAAQMGDVRMLTQAIVHYIERSALPGGAE